MEHAYGLACPAKWNDVYKYLWYAYVCVQVSWYDGTIDIDHERAKLPTATSSINLQCKN